MVSADYQNEYNLEIYQDARAWLKKHDVPQTGWSTTIIVAESLARSISLEKISSNGRLRLTKSGKSYTWRNGYNSLNNPKASRVVEYKDVMSRLLTNRGIQTPENAVFRASEEERAWAWAKPIRPLVLKPHNGKHGTDVHVGIGTRGEFVSAFRQVATNNKTVLVEQFVSGVEHRCFVVDDKLIAAIWRRPASILGNDKSSIRELVENKNKNRIGHSKLKLGAQERHTLKQQGLSPQDVPAAGQRIYIRQTSNLHTGGDAIDATDEISDKEREFIERAATAVPGLRVGGLDVLLPRGGKGEAPAVIEMNRSTGLRGHHLPWEGKPRDVAGAILDAMFG